MSSEFEYDDKAFKKLIESIKNSKLEVHVGILGNSPTRNDAGETNATIGIRHELGLGVPQRSFLLMPIQTRFKKEVKAQKALSQETVKQMLAAASFMPLMQKLAVVAERCVLLAFDTGGFGAWKQSNMEYKAVKMTLVETQQLRNSITSEVVVA